MKRILWLLTVFILLEGTIKAETVTYSCIFNRSHIAEWNKNKFSEQDSNSKISLTYIYDIVLEKAYMIGNNGVSNVIHILSGDKITFIERTPSGNMTMTTVYSSKNDKHAAVHSRHIEFIGGSVNSQYYGYCMVK